MRQPPDAGGEQPADEMRTIPRTRRIHAPVTRTRLARAPIGPAAPHEPPRTADSTGPDTDTDPQ